MIVCVCNAVTESEIREHVRAGACTLADLAGCAGVGAGCGRCREAAAVILKESKAARRPAPIERWPYPMPA